MYKEASKQRLRIATSKGLLSVEQLWDLPVDDLDSLAVSLNEAYNSSKGKSFITKRTTKDKFIKLQLDITLDILLTKVAEQEIKTQQREDKLHNEKIFSIIAEKQTANLI